MRCSRQGRCTGFALSPFYLCPFSSYEDDKDHDKALEVYKLSLSFVPENKEALRSIRYLKAMKVGQIQPEVRRRRGVRSRPVGEGRSHASEESRTLFSEWHGSYRQFFFFFLL